jgi:hypothetical protein
MSFEVRGGFQTLGTTYLTTDHHIPVSPVTETSSYQAVQLIPDERKSPIF